MSGRSLDGRQKRPRPQRQQRDQGQKRKQAGEQGGQQRARDNVGGPRKKLKTERQGATVPSTISSASSSTNKATAHSLAIPLVEVDLQDPTWQRRVEGRHKQLEIGKNTEGYSNYRKQVPFSERDPSEKHGKHPATPNPYLSSSKRSWEGQVKKWRRLLHQWDPAACFQRSICACAPTSPCSQQPATG
eukprot:gb/GEZN01022295.1/.p1 GENE.gb/GEZN01022295.1/~~gb/GEZN01022295.1/.p1  ORF type:complete len:188 (+),score=34.73 gb/GEZN01022295.1/:40-603(+)